LRTTALLITIVRRLSLIAGESKKRTEIVLMFLW